MSVRHLGHGGFILADTCWEEGQPWLRPEAARYIEGLLPQGAGVFEWGSGASTIWLARRGYAVTSMERDRSWAQAVRARLNNEGLQYARVLDFSDLSLQLYADHILLFNDEMYDLILVDGRARNRCLRNAMSKVKVGGLLCLDNSERTEYANGVALLDTWDGVSWGDEGWMTTVWQRDSNSVISFVNLEVEDA